MTPDGQVLLFSSVPSAPGQQYVEFYRYSTATGTTCISCNPTGQNPLGPASLQSREGIAPSAQGSVPGGISTTNFSRNLSSDGDFVFFESPDALTHEDTNGDSGCVPFKSSNPTGAYRECQDVYEWEAAGTPGGSCHIVEVNGGCLYLLSSGQSQAASFFVGASTDGRVAFIATTSPLVATDTDEAYDVYSVRAGGGLASQQEVADHGCQAEACQGSATGQPLAPPLASSQLVGPSNKKQHKKKQHKKKQHKKEAAQEEAAQEEARE